jgi:UDP-glucose 4-epimerase
VAKIDRTFEIYNVGSDDKLDVLQIADTVINELSLNNVNLTLIGGIDGRGWKGDVREMLLDSSKLVASGWKPKYNSREAVILAARGIIKSLDKA